MKKISTVLLLMGLAACSQDLKPRVEQLEKENRILKEMAGPLPSSLNNYFPPKASSPVYLMEMFALSGPFESIGIDLQEKDLSGVKANFDAFKAQYQKMAGMVPEWKEKFPIGPVDTLGQAIARGEPAQVGRAMGQIGQVCGSCHMLNQIKAQQKYQWPDFDALTLSDPVTNEATSWHESMVRMAGAYTGIENDLQQGQIENVRLNFQAFSTRFKAMTASCDACHDSPRAYFTGTGVQGMLSELGKAVGVTPPDNKTIGQMIGAIGNESCMKCHLVHMPSANSKSLWKAYADVFRQP